MIEHCLSLLSMYFHVPPDLESEKDVRSSHEFQFTGRHHQFGRRRTFWVVLQERAFVFECSDAIILVPDFQSIVCSFVRLFAAINRLLSSNCDGLDSTAIECWWWMWIVDDHLLESRAKSENHYSSWPYSEALMYTKIWRRNEFNYYGKVLHTFWGMVEVWRGSIDTINTCSYSNKQEKWRRIRIFNTQNYIKHKRRKK